MGKRCKEIPFIPMGNTCLFKSREDDVKPSLKLSRLIHTHPPQDTHNPAMSKSWRQKAKENGVEIADIYELR